MYLGKGQWPHVTSISSSYSLSTSSSYNLFTTTKLIVNNFQTVQNSSSGSSRIPFVCRWCCVVDGAAAAAPEHHIQITNTLYKCWDGRSDGRVYSSLSRLVDN